MNFRRKQPVFEPLPQKVFHWCVYRKVGQEGRQEEESGEQAEEQEEGHPRGHLDGGVFSNGAGQVAQGVLSHAPVFSEGFGEGPQLTRDPGKLFCPAHQFAGGFD